ncbi:MAG TPA: STAS domain-containing protein [Spirochaetia bacterium]|jgi:anti-anti-sigma factor|nr:STAS domain-containing protein [Spirochaetales bacterium]HRY72586.1 STAS domain-containing protein [Spirochaetia bacterium]
MTQLDIVERRDGDRLVVAVAGPVNSYTYTDFQEKVSKALAAHPLVVVDMEKVTTLSSAGIGVLMAALDEAEAEGKRIVVLRPSEIARLALDSTGFGERFPVAQNIRDL